MQKHWKSLIWHLGCCCCLGIFLAISQQVEAQERQPAAEIIALTGQAEVKTWPEPSFHKAQLRDKLYPRDQIKTLEKSKAKLWFQDESVLILAEKTRLEIAQYLVDKAAGRRQSLLRTLKGKMRFIVHKFFGAPQPDFNIEIPSAVIGIRGTDGMVDIGAGPWVKLKTGPPPGVLPSRSEPTGREEPFRRDYCPLGIDAERTRTADFVYLFKAQKPLALTNKSTGEQLDLRPMTFAISQVGKPFQIERITPATRDCLIKMFLMSYFLTPHGLIKPPSPRRARIDIRRPPPPMLPPVDQAPLTVIHNPKRPSSHK